MDEPGIRPEFWITIVVAIVMLILFVRGQWEWAVVAVIATMALGRLAFRHWPRHRR